MSESLEKQWLVTYLEGDSRLKDRRHGILKLNSEKERIEFTVQTSEAQNAPFVVVSYPVKYLRSIKVIEKRERIRKKEFLELSFGDPPDIMHPVFAFSLDNPLNVKKHLEEFKEDMKNKRPSKTKPEPEIFELFASLIMKPVEQLQSVMSDVSSQIRSLTRKPVEIGRKIIPAEDDREFEIQEVTLNNRVVKFHQSTHKYKTTLVLLSPLGGKLEDLIPLLHSLRKGKFNTILLGIRGFTSPVEQDTSFKLNDYIDDLLDFLGFLAPSQKIVLGAHSLLSAILFEEFIKEKYGNITKFISFSGIHRAPKTFRGGVKKLPPAKVWRPFKGQVRKIAPQILFTPSFELENINLFMDHAFSIPDRVYSNIFRSFLPRYDYTNNLQKMQKPLLTIWGHNDQLIPEELRNEMKKTFQNQNFIFKTVDGSHMFFYEVPEIAGEQICDFIDLKRSNVNIV